MKTNFHKRNNKFLVLYVAILLIFGAVALFLCLNQHNLNMLICGFSKHSENSLKVYTFDVGQASSSLVILPTETTFLIDAGTEDSDDQLVKELRWVLKDQKLHGIDFFILTHPDADHVGGAPAIFDAFQVGSVRRPKVVARSERNPNGYYCVTTNAYNNAVKAMYAEPNCEVKYTEDELFQFDEGFLQIYACEQKTYSETNAFSPFVHVSGNDRDFLFTGDATEQREIEFLQRLSRDEKTLKIDFLTVAHHGSKYSSSMQFLQAITPKYALISAGDISHPSSVVLKRLKDCGTKHILVTKDVGTFAIFVDEDGNFVVRTMQNKFDFPFFVTIWICVGFVLMQVCQKKMKKQDFSLKTKKNT